MSSSDIPSGASGHLKHTVPEDDIREVKYFTNQVYIVKYFRGRGTGCEKSHGVYYVVHNRFYDIECDKQEASFQMNHAAFCNDPHGHRMYVEPIIFYIPEEKIKPVMTKGEILEVFNQYLSSEHNMEDRLDYLPRQRRRT